VVVKQKPGQLDTEGPLFRMSGLEFRIGIRDILDKRINVERLGADAPEFVLVRDESGNMNFADLLERPAKEEPPGEKREVAANIEIEGGRILFLDRKTGTRMEAREIDAQAKWRNGRLDLELDLDLNGGETSAKGWLDLSRKPSPFRMETIRIEGARLSADMTQLGLVIPLMGEKAEEATGTLSFSVDGLEADGLGGPAFSSTLRGKGEVTLEAGTLVSRPAAQLQEAVRTARIAIQAIRDKDYTKLLKIRLPGTGEAAEAGRIEVDRLHGTFTISGGRVVTEDMTFKASDWSLTVAGSAGLDGSVDYLFQEESLTRRYLELTKERPEVRQLIGEVPGIRYRKAAGSPGGFEIPWLDPKKLATSLMGSALSGEGVTDRLKDLLRRDK
jgi:hypothetical protein